MSQRLSRRASMRWIGAGAFAGVMGGMPARTFAEDIAPPAPGENLQGAGFYRFMIGGAQVIVASDGAFLMELGQTLGANAAPGAVGQAMADAALTDKDTLGQVNVVLIKAYPNNILIDTGCGPLFGEGTGQCLKNLARAGVTPEQITDVVITHLHPDHIGGLMGEKGAAVYPKATFHLHKAEEAFWTGAKPDLSNSGLAPAMRDEMIGAARAALAAVKGRLKLVDDGSMVGDARIIHLPGHTPGHVGVRYQNGSDVLTHVTDAVHFPLLQLDHPEWFVSYDADREQAVKTRRAILERAAEEKCWVTGAHLTFPALGRIRKAGQGFDWRGTIWRWS